MFAYHVLYTYKVLLRGVVGFESRGCRKLKSGKMITIRRSYLCDDMMRSTMCGSS